MSDDLKMTNYSEFWPYYLSQHRNRICRGLHFIGTTLAIVIIMIGITWKMYLIILIAPIAGYACSWIGHFVFEKNKPATFCYPLWSFRAELQMYLLMWTGRLPTWKL